MMIITLRKDLATFDKDSAESIGHGGLSGGGQAAVEVLIVLAHVRRYYQKY